jgi:hypothetical protein
VVVRHAMVVAAGVLLLVGCGGGGKAPAPAARATASKPNGPTGSKAPVLVQLTQQRPGALLDKITVPAGNVGKGDGSPAVNGATYIMRCHGARSWRARAPSPRRCASR